MGELELPADEQAPDTTVQLTLVANGLNRPTYVAAAPGDRSRLFIVEKGGRIRIVTIQNGVYTLLPTPFLDITSSVISSGTEQGLLSMAFHPDYANNGYFYVAYTGDVAPVGQSVVVARYQVSADPNIANPNSKADVLVVEHPASVHNGGQLHFGADGYLYISLGDGAYAEPGGNNALNLGVLLGKILRIDINSAPYAIPPDNPFVSDPNALDEIWSYGLRNPWRFSFDRLAGDMWIGDVGQARWEEVDREQAGSPGGTNWGWPCLEGTEQYIWYPECPSLNLVPPVAVFDHATEGWCAVTGGYVYRGSPNSNLFGDYVFADYCRSNSLTSLRNVGGTWVRTDFTLVPPSGTSLSLASSMGQDAIGDLYITDDSSSNGEVFKLQLRPPACIAGNFDVNGDGAVTLLDIQLVAGDWGREDFVSDYDVNCSGAVDIVDILLVAKAWSS